jgi:hypothetical protein
MKWLQRFNRFYYLWLYWPFIVGIAVVIAAVVGAFIDEPRFTLATLKEFVAMIVLSTFSVAYTRERREFLRQSRAQALIGCVRSPTGSPPCDCQPRGGEDAIAAFARSRRLKELD